MGLLNSLYALRDRTRHYAFLIRNNNQIQMNENQDICRRYPGFVLYMTVFKSDMVMPASVLLPELYSARRRRTGSSSLSAAT